jgi:ABC-type multidrug transport system fused ATPase/permease subunit
LLSYISTTHLSARIFIPYYTGQVIANIVVSKSYAALLESVLIMTALSVIRLVILSINVQLSLLFSAIFGGGRAGCFSYAIAKVNRQVREDLFSSLVQQEIGFFDATKTGKYTFSYFKWVSGEVTSRLTADCQVMSDTVALNVNVFLRNILMLVGSLAFMFALSWRLTLITFVAVPVIGLISKLYGSYYEVYF